MTVIIEEIISKINAKILATPDKASALAFKLGVNLESGFNFVVDCTKNLGVRLGKETVDCSISLSDSDFIDIYEKRLNPQIAFMSGKLKVHGEVSHLLKLGAVL